MQIRQLCQALNLVYKTKSLTLAKLVLLSLFSIYLFFFPTRMELAFVMEMFILLNVLILYFQLESTHLYSFSLYFNYYRKKLLVAYLRVFWQEIWSFSLGLFTIYTLVVCRFDINVLLSVFLYETIIFYLLGLVYLLVENKLGVVLVFVLGIVLTFVSGLVSNFKYYYFGFEFVETMYFPTRIEILLFYLGLGLGGYTFIFLVKERR